MALHLFHLVIKSHFLQLVYNSVLLQLRQWSVSAAKPFWTHWWSITAQTTWDSTGNSVLTGISLVQITWERREDEAEFQDKLQDHKNIIRKILYAI